MSNRLNQEQEQKLQPARIEFAIDQLLQLGFDLTYSDNTMIEFYFKDELVKFYPCSGWHTGKSIKDGRGWDNLKKQLLKNNTI